MSEGYKNDRREGKVMWELVPLEGIEEIAKVFTFGASKYGAWTWDTLDNGYERYKAAFFRHVRAFESGEYLDTESGLPHLSHALWNALAMQQYGIREQGRTERERRLALHDSYKK